MRTGVEFISSCACMGIIIILPSCAMFDRAKSNVKLASSSRVEVLHWSARVENEYEYSTLAFKFRVSCTVPRQGSDGNE